MNRSAIIWGLAVLLFSLSAQAHPVSFADSWSLISLSSKKMRELSINHSFSHRFALSYAYLKDADSEFHIPRGNFLIKRWNEVDSQGNFYLSLGAGSEKFQGQSRAVNLGEFILDWESRKYYSAFEHRLLRREEESKLGPSPREIKQTKARLGFAPFLAEYSDLNIWWIAQFDKYDDQENIEAKQFLRFYIRNVLWEVGSDFNGNMSFNFMMHL